MKSLNIQSKGHKKNGIRTKLGSAIALSLILTVSSPIDAQNNISPNSPKEAIGKIASDENILMTKSSIALLEGATDTLLKSVFREIEIDTNTIAKDFVPMLDSIKKGLKELKEKIENNNPIYENDLLKYNESLMEYIDRINNLDDNIKLKPYIFRH